MFCILTNNTNYNNTNIGSNQVAYLIKDAKYMPTIIEYEITSTKEYNPKGDKILGKTYVINNLFECYVASDQRTNNSITFKGLLYEQTKKYNYGRLYQIIQSKENLEPEFTDELTAEQMKEVDDFIRENDRDKLTTSEGDIELKMLFESIDHLKYVQPLEFQDILIDFNISYSVNRDLKMYKNAKTNTKTKGFARMKLRTGDDLNASNTPTNAYGKMNLYVPNTDHLRELTNYFDPLYKFVLLKTGKYTEKDLSDITKKDNNDKTLFGDLRTYINENKTEGITSTIEASIQDYIYVSNEANKNNNEINKMFTFLKNLDKKTDEVDTGNLSKDWVKIIDKNDLYKYLFNDFLKNKELNKVLSEKIDRVIQANSTKGSVAPIYSTLLEDGTRYVYTELIRYLAFSVTKYESENIEEDVKGTYYMERRSFKNNSIYKLNVSNRILKLMRDENLTEKFISELKTENDIKKINDLKLDELVEKWLEKAISETNLCNSIKYVNGGFLFNLFVTLNARGFTNLNIYTQPSLKFGTMQESGDGEGKKYLKVNHAIKCINKVFKREMNNGKVIENPDNDF